MGGGRDRMLQNRKTLATVYRENSKVERSRSSLRNEV